MFKTGRGATIIAANVEKHTLCEWVVLIFGGQSTV